MEELSACLPGEKSDRIKAGVGMLFRRGEGYYDAVNGCVRFRHLCNAPIPQALYEVSAIERDVEKYSKLTFDNMTVRYTRRQEFVFATSYQEGSHQPSSKTELTIDQDGQITKLNCSCKAFKRGARNLSEPCAHILALYVASYKLLKLEHLEYEKEYKINDIMEMLL